MKCPGGIQIELSLLVVSLAVCMFCTLPCGYLYTNVNQIQPILVQFANVSIQAHYAASLSRPTLLLVWGFIIGIGGVVSLATVWIAYPLKARFGCKRCLFGLGCGSIGVAAVLQCAAKYACSIELWTVSIIFASSACCWVINIFGPIYLSECAPPNLRGIVGLVGTMGLYIGIFLSFVIGLPSALGTNDLWGIYCLLPAGFALCGILVSFWLPHSPKDLYTTLNDKMASRRSVLALFGEEHHNIDKVIADFHEEHEQTSEDFRLTHLFTERHLRKALFLNVLLSILGATSGPYVLFFYTNSVFLNVGIPSEQAGTLNIVLIVPLLFLTPLSTFVVERLGRRTLVIGIGTAMTGALSVYVVCGTLAVQTFPEVIWLRYVAALGILLDFWLMPLGPPIVALFLPSELFPQHARTAGSAAAGFTMNMCFAIILTVFPSLLELLGPLAAIVVFIAPSLVALGVLWKMMPETAGRAVNEIVRELMGDTHFGTSISTAACGNSYGAIEKSDTTLR